MLLTFHAAEQLAVWDMFLFQEKNQTPSDCANRIENRTTVYATVKVATFGQLY